MEYAIRIGVLALVSLFLATASSAEEVTQDREGERDRPGMAEHCPWAMPDVDAGVEDTEEGAALTLRGDPEQEEELRRFGERMAEMHERMGPHHGRRHMEGEGAQEGRHRGEGDRMEGHHHREDRGGMGRMMMEMPEAVVEAEDVEGGVRLEFTARDPDDREALREHVHEHAEMMQEGHCPMRAAPDDEENGS